MTSVREALLVKSWMSHDARWFNAVAQEFGLEAANRLNQTAAREAGTAEGRRAVRELGLGDVPDGAACAHALDTLVGTFGGSMLLDYETRVEAAGVSVTVHRCFAHENVTRAGIADRYDCGIFARVEGWLAGVGCNATVTPGLKGCLKAQGAPCVHEVRIK